MSKFVALKWTGQPGSIPGMPKHDLSAEDTERILTALGYQLDDVLALRSQLGQPFYERITGRPKRSAKLEEQEE